MNPLLLELLASLVGFTAGGGIGAVENQLNPQVQQKPTLGDWLRVALFTGLGAAAPPVAQGLADATSGASALATEGASSAALGNTLPFRPPMASSFPMSTTPVLSTMGVGSDRLAFSPTTGVQNVFTPGMPPFQPAPLPTGFQQFPTQFTTFDHPMNQPFTLPIR